MNRPSRLAVAAALLLALGQGADLSIVPALPNVFTAGDMATGDEEDNS